jgi:predicted ester cyclase
MMEAPEQGVSAIMNAESVAVSAKRSGMVPHAMFRMGIMTDFNRTIDAFYAAYAAYDAGAAAALYAEEGSHEEMAMAKRRVGQVAIRDGLAGFFQMLPDVTWTEQERIASGSSVAVVYAMRGTFTPRARDGEPAPQPKAVFLRGLHMFEFSESGLQATKDYWSLDSFKQQIA